MHSISKSFGATQALRDVSAHVERGSVLALIGENGAGKSTLMKVLSGVYRPDSGRMELNGKHFAPLSPQAARRAGVAMIYQELNLAPDLSVEDNIMLGQEESRLGLLSRKSQRQQVRAALSALGHPELQPQTLVRSLSVGAQQLVEIARALVLRAQVLVFDEPTSSLPRRDVDRLFSVVRKLRAAGLGIIYISHFLEEIREVADTYAVLRDGLIAGQGQLAETADDAIISLMVGRAVTELFPRIEHHATDTILEVRQLSGQSTPNSVSLEIRRGEILGIAGLVGAGRTELLRCIFGLDMTRSGAVSVAGQVTESTPRARIQAGLGYVSEDRKSEGLAQDLSISDNVTLSKLRPYAFAGLLNLRRRHHRVMEWMRRLDVRAANVAQEVQYLSGGNQQKVALARVVHQNADVYLLDEPTRGIDLGTKSEIYRLMGELAASGKAIIFVSSYLPELLAVCDRLAVMARGTIRDVRPVDSWDEESVMACATGGDG